MIKHLPIILRATSYFLMLAFVEIAKQFNDAGAAKLMEFKWGDWAVLVASIGSVTFIGLNAFFSTAFTDHMNKIHSGNTEFINKADLPK